MTRDYSQPNDPYGISEMTAQSADQDVNGPVWRRSGGDRDVRGNTLVKPRSVPTQEECDAIKGVV
jgi:hypothetical protein